MLEFVRLPSVPGFPAILFISMLSVAVQINHPIFLLAAKLLRMLPVESAGIREYSRSALFGSLTLQISGRSGDGEPADRPQQVAKQSQIEE
jgi:hypothetical protein